MVALIGRSVQERLRKDSINLLQALPGTKVYKIKLRYHNKNWTHFVFCNPATHRVVSDAIFLPQKLVLPHTKNPYTVGEEVLYSMSATRAYADTVTDMLSCTYPIPIAPMPDGDLSIYRYNRKTEQSPTLRLHGYLSIYRYGLPLTSCENNFKNLFRNWGTLFVDNADDIRLLSCSHVDSIGTPAQAATYVALLAQDTMPAGFVGRRFITFNSEPPYCTNTELLVLNKGDAQYRRLMRINTDINELNNDSTAEEDVTAALLGTKVFRITFSLTGRQQKVYSYAFCDPKTHRVVVDEVFGNVSIPLNQIQ